MPNIFFGLKLTPEILVIEIIYQHVWEKSKALYKKTFMMSFEVIKIRKEKKHTKNRIVDRVGWLIHVSQIYGLGERIPNHIYFSSFDRYDVTHDVINEYNVIRTITKLFTTTPIYLNKYMITVA